MEGGDLVVVHVRGNEGLGGVTAGDQANMAAVDAEMVESLHVETAVVADRGHDGGLAAEQLQVVGDVARATPVFPPHVGDEENGDVNLLRQDVVNRH
jgi:hypothetical protein